MLHTRLWNILWLILQFQFMIKTFHAHKWQMSAEICAFQILARQFGFDVGEKQFALNRMPMCRNTGRLS